jgi:hypothetical protein
MKLALITLFTATSLFAQTQRSYLSKEAKARFEEQNVTFSRKFKKLDQHITASKERFMNEMGVSEASLDFFWKGLKKEDKPKDDMKVDTCLEQLDDKVGSRNFVLACLGRISNDLYDAKLFAALEDIKEKKSKIVPTTKPLQQTIMFIFFLQEVTREVLFKKGHTVNWFYKGKGFQAIENPEDFPYQNGDIVLEMADGSTSALITQSTYPRRAFAHGMMIRKKEGENPVTAESLIESGVIERDVLKDVFTPDKTMNSVDVLRLREYIWGEKRKTVIKEFVDYSTNAVETNIPYDFPMDMSTRDKVFCSELVSRGLMHGLRKVDSWIDQKDDVKAQQTIIPLVSKIRSKRVLKFLDGFGVKNETMASPGDITSSQYLTTAGTYRSVSKDGKLFIGNMWDRLLFGDVLIERIDYGYRVSFTAISRFIIGPLLDGIDAVSDFFFGDPTFMPAGINSKSLGYLAVLELMIFKPVFSGYNDRLAEDFTEEQRYSIIEIPPWVRRGYLSYSLKKSTKAGFALKFKRN